MRKVCGVGINDCKGWGSSSNKGTLNYRIYNLWVAMINRCYNSRVHQNYPTYKGAEVCLRWRTLSNFAEDIKLLPGYDLWKNNPNQKIALDKDILGNGSMEYSPTTCCFVTMGDNNIEMSHRNPLKNSKRVKAINLTTGDINYYNSTADTKKDGFDRGTVSKVCRGIYPQHKGWKFEYCEESEYNERC